MAKKQKCPEFENHERWLVAFADMMTLLFALFVVLFSIANVEVEKLKKVSSSIQKAFGIPNEDSKEEGGMPKGNSRTEGIFNKVKGDTKRESISSRTRREMIALITADAKELERKMADRLYGDKDFPSGQVNRDDRVVFVNRDNDGIRITLLARKFFKPNMSTIDIEAKKALDGVAATIKDIGKMIRIEGHSDSLPVHINGITNWELSSLRAAAVARYLIEKHDFNKQSIYAAGFADAQPIAPNDTPENRAMNRRVDIKILYDTPHAFSEEDSKGEEGDETGVDPQSIPPGWEKKAPDPQKSKQKR